MAYTPEELNSIIMKAGLSASLQECNHVKSPINRNKNMITKIINWFVWSSANPNALSLTLKGLVPLLLLVGIDANDGGILADNVSQAVLGIGYVITAVVTVGGLLRKIASSF